MCPPAQCGPVGAATPKAQVVVVAGAHTPIARAHKNSSPYMAAPAKVSHPDQVGFHVASRITRSTRAWVSPQSCLATTLNARRHRWLARSPTCANVIIEDWAGWV